MQFIKKVHYNLTIYLQYCSVILWAEIFFNQDIQVSFRVSNAFLGLKDTHVTEYYMCVLQWPCRVMDANLVLKVTSFPMRGPDWPWPNTVTLFSFLLLEPYFSLWWSIHFHVLSVKSTVKSSGECSLLQSKSVYRIHSHKQQWMLLYMDSSNNTNV